MDTKGNWKELAAQKEREWKELTELRLFSGFLFKIKNSNINALIVF